MVLVSLPKKPCFYRVLQRVNGSDTNGTLETRGVECLTIQFPPLPSSQSVGITGIKSSMD
jgi:hypothetical protein